MKKDFQPQHYARLIDRMLINSDKPQLFGTQIQYDTNGKGVFYPIENPEYINQRRLKLGLTSIQEFAKQRGIKWTII